MKQIVRYKTKIPYEGYTWNRDKLIPNSGELKSDWLPDRAYLDFLNSARKLEKAKDKKEKKEIISEFTHQYGSLLPAEVRAKEKAKTKLKDLNTTITSFENASFNMLNLQRDYQAGLLEEVQKNIKVHFSSLFRVMAEVVDKKISFVFEMQTLDTALHYQFISALGTKNKLKICVMCGTVMEGKSNRLTCSDKCRTDKSLMNKKSKGRK